MSTFKIKDLMVTVDRDSKMIETVKYCRYPSIDLLSRHCCRLTPSRIPCGNTKINCGRTFICQQVTLPDCGISEYWREGDWNIEELDQAKAEIEQLQQQAEAGFSPRTAEDFSLLESKLTDALAELKIQKSKLKQG